MGATMRFLIILLLLFCYQLASAKQNIVNVFAWSGYLSSEVVDQFEKQTGITINFTQYATSEEMYAKLRNSRQSGYDVIIPSANYVPLLAKQGMLHPLDKSRLTHFTNLDPAFTNPEFDPNNRYSIPFYWGANIIGINTRYHKPKDFHSWESLWRKQYRNRLLIVGDIYDVFSMVMLHCGYSPNSRDPQQIKTAYEKLRALWPNVKVINTDNVQSLLSDEDITLGLAWSGDIYAASLNNPHVTGIYPKQGFVVWVDNLSIPRNAPHLDNAYRLLNFLLRADIAAKLSLSSGFATPNKAAKKLLPESVRNNKLLYPSEQTLKRAQFESYTGKADALYRHYWQRFRLGA